MKLPKDFVNYFHAGCIGFGIGAIVSLLLILSDGETVRLRVDKDSKIITAQYNGNLYVLTPLRVVLEDGK
jgi:hypothetical protein